MVLLGLIPSLIVIGLLIITFYVSFQTSVTTAGYTFQHYVDLYTDPFTYQTFANTLGFAGVMLVFAFLFGVPLAWLVERTNLPGKSFVYSAVTLAILLPGFFTAMGWLFLAHPKIGMLNQMVEAITGSTDPVFNVVGIPGMGFVQGLSLAPLVFTLTATSLRTMDASLEEAARTSGASFLKTLWRVTLPLSWPSLLAAALYTFTIGISAFDVPAVIGMSNRIFTFSTYLYLQTHPLQGPPNYGIAGAFSTFMLIVGLLMSWWYSRVLVHARKYQVVTGKAFRPKIEQLGAWVAPAWIFIGLFLLLAEILPVLLLIFTAGEPYLQPPTLKTLQTLSFSNVLNLQWSLIQRGAVNSAWLVIGAPTFALLFSFVLSWVVLRTRVRFRFVFDFIAFLPHAVPSIIFGVAALLAALFVVTWPPGLYGSVVLLLIVYSVVNISFATRVTNSALIQIHPELEEAGYVSGASRFTVFRRILTPLLRPAFFTGWLWMALLCFRELTLATVLFAPSNITLPEVVWSLWYAGQQSQAAGVTLIMMAVLFPFIVIYRRLAGTRI